MALAVIEAAERRGDLRPGGTIVEYTMGTTGISLAFVGAAKGYRVGIVYSDAFSDEKRRLMQAFGAAVTDVPSGGAGTTPAPVCRMIAAAWEIANRPNHWASDQLANVAAVDAYHPMGYEIWEPAGGRVDTFVHTVRTAHPLHGTMRGIRRHRPDIRAVAVGVLPWKPPTFGTFAGDRTALIGKYHGPARGRPMTIEVTDTPQGLAFSVNGSSARPLPYVEGLTWQGGAARLTFVRPSAGGSARELRFDGGGGLTLPPF